ncbi:MAG: PIN domain nuclease [Thauera sp.]|nr:MAG: PIN domain nuclease [Thauera sp.]
MRILLDTHVLIWLSHAPERIAAAAREKIVDPSSTLYISPASIWEMTIKCRLGKLDLGTDIVSFTRTAYLELAALELPLALDHFGHLSELPLHHHDPFDRLLLAQARSERLDLATADGVFDAYADVGVSVLRC